MSIDNKYYGSVRLKKRIAIFFMFFVLFRFGPAYGMRIPETSIEPTDKVELTYGQPIPVQVRISDPDSILMVRCYFRYQSQASLFFVELKVGEDGLYHGSLPASGSTVNEIEFQYVVINASHQIICSQRYSAGLQIGMRQYFSINSEVSTCRIWTELATAVNGEDQFFNPEQVKIEIVAKEERYGLAAGLYTPEDLAGIGIVEGYFGAFILREDGRPLPIKGIMLNSGTVATMVDSSNNKLPTTSLSTQPTTPKAGTDLIGPDIAGEDWHGLCYYGWGESLGLLLADDPTPVTAHVTHEGLTMAITLSTVCYIYGEKIGPYLSGNIDSYGNVLVLDQRVPPQTWSSHWGPVTATKILIGDYVTLPTPDNPYADYYVIELEREPSPIVPASLPAVYKLLL